MSILRSEDIELYKLSIHKDFTWNIMNELGKLNCLHFINVNQGLQPHELKYTQDIKNSEAALHKLDYIERKMNEFDIYLKQCPDMDDFLEKVKDIARYMGKASNNLFTPIFNDINDIYNHIKQQITTLDSQKLLFKDTVFRVAILNETKRLVGERADLISEMQSRIADNESGPVNENDVLININESNMVQIEYIGGVIESSDIEQFKRFLIRTTRAQVLIHSFDLKVALEDQIIGDKYHEKKTIFILAFQSGATIESKIRKICKSFNGIVFDVEIDHIDIDKNNELKIKEHTKSVIKQTNDSFKDFLIQSNGRVNPDVSIFCAYRLFVNKEKMVYYYMNMLQAGEMVSHGLVWVPKYVDFENVLENYGMRGLSYEKAVEADILIERPTHFRLNDFTWPFQELINTYGVPEYKELNPTPFACVSFPFLFGIMFGDIMHGTLLTITALYICWTHKDGSKNPFNQGRYMLLLMGLFATFCGLIYNEFSSLGTEIFAKSCYQKRDFEKVREINGAYWAHQAKDCVYPFGFDPVWFRAQQEIMYFNSFKMKISVLFGVGQMLLGTTLKGFNAIYFNRKLEFVFVVVAQIILMLSLFGFMDMLIIVKWTTDWEGKQKAYHKLHPKLPLKKAPSIITTMIEMFIQGGVHSKDSLDFDLIPNQTKVMNNLVIFALVSIPSMLFILPCFQSGPKQPYKELKDVDDENKANGEQHIQNMMKPLLPRPEDHSFGTVFIHSIIETIEYVLGTISNTASYLRLWALSLAHGQLAKVFFDNTVGMGLKSKSYAGIFIGYYVFFGASFAVIMLMDCLECCLHCVRLHWVEFQNKFFKGSGYNFKPYSFDDIFNEDE